MFTSVTNAILVKIFTYLSICTEKSLILILHVMEMQRISHHDFQGMSSHSIIVKSFFLSIEKYFGDFTIKLNFQPIPAFILLNRTQRSFTLQTVEFG